MNPAILIWNSPSEDSTGSMPLGNGDIGVNVWAQRDGRIRFYLSKVDAWDGLGRLIKVGAFDLWLTPNPFDDGANFSQTLDAASGSIVIKASHNGTEFAAKIWVDACSSTVFIEGHSSNSIRATARLNLWRQEPRTINAKENHCAIGKCAENEAQRVGIDTIADFGGNVIGWFHHNLESVWGKTLEHQNLKEFKSTQSDPLLHRIFGAAIAGAGFQSQGKGELIAEIPAFELHITALTQSAATPEQWMKDMRLQLNETPSATAAWPAHAAWWNGFWERSGIEITAGPDAEEMTVAYALQRFVFACQGRGAYPMKFNGGIFTMDSKVDGDYDVDYRRWGGAYWFQNTRLLYWPLLNSGDFEMMTPLFDMYCDVLPLAEARTQKYFGHPGAFFPETMTFWGTYLNDNYGYDRTGKALSEIENRYIRYYWQGGLELLNLGLDFYEFTRDETFLKDTLLKLAVPILRFYQEHYRQRDDNGKVLFKPAQALETWHEAVNPLPEIAGLQTVIGRLLQIDLIPVAETDAWRCIQELLPPLPQRHYRCLDERTELIPALQYDDEYNVENVALYAVFPYRLYGIGKPELQTGRDTYAARPFKSTGCWRQDAIQAALLGLAEEARNYVTRNVTEFNTLCRFPVFWATNPANDWIPDEDHGGVIMTALQRMLIQADDGKIHLLPAWPKNWDVRFKLCAPGHTVVTGEVKDGKIIALEVLPESRKQDLIIHEAQ